MTMRSLAFVLAAVLAAPAALAIIRGAWATRDRQGSRARRAQEALWVALPIALVALLFGLAVSA